jgi:hypothetical protein
MKHHLIALTAALIAVAGISNVSAQLGNGDGPSAGTRGLTQQVASLADDLRALSGSHRALQATVQTLTGQIAALQAENSALQAALACVATDSGPGRFVLRGCDLAIERLADGSAVYGNVEVAGVLIANEIGARVDDIDPRSGDLLITAGESLSLISGSASLVLQKSGDIEIEGKDLELTGSGDIEIKAASRIRLAAAVIEYP